MNQGCLYPADVLQIVSDALKESDSTPLIIKSIILTQLSEAKDISILNSNVEEAMAVGVKFLNT